jgi:cyclophilin family peptidyl-prolyl cis-trans isomerase
VGRHAAGRRLSALACRSVVARRGAVFAEVIEGIDVVDGILEGDVMARVTVER